MSMSLEISFKMSDNKTKTLRINNPLADPTREKIEPVMEEILALNAYGDDKVSMAAIKGAKVRDTAVIFEA